MRLFDLVRIAVNGDKHQAREYVESLRERAGLAEPASQKVVIASQAELDALLTGRR